MKTVRLTPLKRPVTATISVPGSKSHTNRALLLAALTPDPVKLFNPLISDDTLAMINCLRTLGVNVVIGSDMIEVVGDILSPKADDCQLDAGLSGTTIRFLTAVCAFLPGRQLLGGQPRLNERPIGDLVESLKRAGAVIEYLGRPGYPPLMVAAPGSQLAEKISINGQESSQYLSALLMAGPLTGHHNLTIEVEGRLNSKPYVDVTIDVMRSFGVTAAVDGSAYHIDGGQRYSCDKYEVEGDASSAAYFWAIAALTGSTLTVQNLNPQSRQADMSFLRILQTMGLTSSPHASALTLKGQSVRSVKVNMRDCPDQVQTLAVLAAFAAGETVIGGVKSLRIKETERVMAVQQELAKMGVRSSATADTLKIEGGHPRPAAISTYNDHRMAMAFAVAGAKLSGMIIEDPDVVTKTFPDFWEKLRSVGIGVSFEENS